MEPDSVSHSFIHPKQPAGMLSRLMKEINGDINANDLKNESANGDTNDPANVPGSPGLLAGLAADVASQKMRVPQDLSLIAQLAQTELKGGLINDKKYLVCPLLN